MKKFNVVTLFSLLVPFLVTSPTALSAERMKSGKWEMTSEGRRARANTECVTTQSSADINGSPAQMRAFVEKSSIAAKCKVENFKMQGDTISNTMACTGASMDTTTSYHGDSYEIVMISKVAGSAPETSRVTAKRVGAC